MGKQFAVQLFSVRKELAKDLCGTLQAVKTMGYDGVECFGGFTHTAQALKAALDDAGLVCCGWHTSLQMIKPENLMATITYNKVIGNTNIVVPWMPEEMHNTKEACIQTAKFFDETAERMAAYGMRLGYHNHNFEFKPLEGSLPMYYFYDNSQRLDLQLDNGNAWSAGPEVDIYEPLTRYPGRAKTVHLKPYSLKTGYATMVGEDDIDWPRFFDVCKKYQSMDWYIVEYECESIYTPLDGVAKCLNALKQMEKEGKI